MLLKQLVSLALLCFARTLSPHYKLCLLSEAMHDLFILIIIYSLMFSLFCFGPMPVDQQTCCLVAPLVFTNHCCYRSVPGPAWAPVFVFISHKSDATLSRARAVPTIWQRAKKPHCCHFGSDLSQI